MKSTILWGVTLCGMVEVLDVSKELPAFVPTVFVGCLFGLLFSPEDGISIFLRNLSEFLPVYTALFFIGLMSFLLLNRMHIWVTYCQIRDLQFFYKI
jgi:hypothetical protein